MAKFRFAKALAPYLERKAAGFPRPEMPDWIARIGRNETTTSRYWMKIFWATPPWINDEQIAEMKKICESCPDGKHVDHIVPLKSNLVCGLHVPWNLQHLTIKLNYAKSNHTWPDSPHEMEDLFGYDTEIDLFDGLRMTDDS